MHYFLTAHFYLRYQGSSVLFTSGISPFQIEFEIFVFEIHFAKALSHKSIFYRPRQIDIYFKQILEIRFQN